MHTHVHTYVHAYFTWVHAVCSPPLPTALCLLCCAAPLPWAYLMGTCVRQPVGVGLSLEFAIRGARFDSGRRAAVAVAVAVAGASLQKLKVIPGGGGGPGTRTLNPASHGSVIINHTVIWVGRDYIYFLYYYLLCTYIYSTHGTDSQHSTAQHRTARHAHICIPMPVPIRRLLGVGVLGCWGGRTRDGVLYYNVGR